MTKELEEIRESKRIARQFTRRYTARNSALEPYRNQIISQHNAGASAREIQSILRRFGDPPNLPAIEVNHSTIWRFIKKTTQHQGDIDHGEI